MDISLIKLISIKCSEKRRSFAALDRINTSIEINSYGKIAIILVRKKKILLLNSHFEESKKCNSSHECEKSTRI